MSVNQEIDAREDIRSYKILAVVTSVESRNRSFGHRIPQKLLLN